MAKRIETTRLAEETLVAFAAYISSAEAGMAATLAGGPFLWSDACPTRAEQIRQGRTEAQLWSGKRPVAVPQGLIHDWIGAAFAPDSTIQKTLALIQNYDNHKNIYAPDVIDSKLISRDGDDFEIYLRLMKKKIITVVLDTWHEVHYSLPTTLRSCCRSYTRRICEIENAGKPSEKAQPPGTGYGFLWRLYSYWRFEERDGGVYLECRAISLTRDVPKGFGWIIDPMVHKLPRQSLVATLESTRKALASPTPVS